MSSGSENCLTAQPRMVSTGISILARALFILAKPGIVLAEVMAGLAGMLLAAPGPPVATVICPVLLAIALAASGAAMLNNILDRRADLRMPRLSRRCQALEIVGTSRVLIISLLLMGSGLMLAAMTSAPLALLLLVAGCLSYIWLYTAWLKRFSPWGVLAGCIPGALPPLIGAAAVSNAITDPPLLLAVFVFIWQLPHFWLLALDCRDQYAQASIPVLPLVHGESLTRILSLAATALLIPITFAIGLLGSLSAVYLSISTIAGIIFLLFCTICLYRTHAYRQGFRASLIYLVTIFAAIWTESLLS